MRMAAHGKDLHCIIITDDSIPKNELDFGIRKFTKKLMNLNTF